MSQLLGKISVMNLTQDPSHMLAPERESYHLFIDSGLRCLPRSVLGMTLDHLWGASPEALGNVEYPFIAITPWSTLAQIDNTC